MGALITKMEFFILISIIIGVRCDQQPIYMSIFEVAGICLIFILAISGCICYCRERFQNFRLRRRENRTENRNENCSCSPNCHCNRSDISTITAPPPYNRLVPQDNFMFQSSNDNLELNYITTKVDELPSYANVIEKKISTE